MSHYRRSIVPGGTYFFTQVTYQRRHWLCQYLARKILRQAIIQVRHKYPFTIDAFVLLPNHFHCLWTLPSGDSDYATRMRLIKTYVTKHCGKQLNLPDSISDSRHKRKESNLWQRRYWEHLIRDELDFNRHVDYIHYNPVRHGLCSAAKEWQYSSFHFFVKQGVYPLDWGINEVMNFPANLGGE